MACWLAVEAAITESYRVPPHALPAFPFARKAKGKTWFAGGLRRRWRESDGTFYDWDHLHGTVEKYDARGRQCGEFDPRPGRQVGPAIAGRRSEP